MKVDSSSISILDNFSRTRSFKRIKYINFKGYRMKRILLLALICFSVSVMAEVKVGMVNIQKIITTIKEGKSVNTTLEKSFKSKQKLIKKEEEAIKKLQADFQKQNLVLSDKAKAKKAQEIQQKMMAVRQQMEKYQREIQNQEKELKKPILDKLKPIIDEISKSESVAMTFEISSSPIVYASSTVDLTDKVIKAYDKKHSK